MKIITLLLLISSLHFSQEAWVKRSNGLPDSLIYHSLSKIDACDSSTAVLFCHPYGPDLFRSAIFLTTNAGISWTQITPPDEVLDYSITCGSIIDKNHFWFCTGEYDPFGGKIYATEDGGKTWMKQFDNPSLTNYLNYIEMFDSMNGIAMGDPVVNASAEKPAVFLKTTDGGKEWKSMNLSSLKGAVSGDVWRRVDFINANTGYFCSSGVIYNTSNGGGVFIPLSFDYQLSVLKFYNEQIGLSFVTMTSGNSYSFRTFDGGNNWDIFKFPISKGHGWGTDIEFIPGNPSRIWGAQGKGLFFSGDTGRTWLRYTPDLPGAVYDIDFSDDKHGWLICNNDVWYTEHGDLVITHTSGDEFQPAEFRLFQNYPNPFNPSTKIKYQLNKPSFVQLKIFNILGSEVAALISGHQNAGVYQVTFEPDNLPGGIYLVQLSAGDQVDVRKMIYLK